MPYLQLSDGRTVPVEGTNFVIGADPVCDLTLQDEGVAPRHAILQFDDDVWRLATLSLQSETKLNGEPVESIVALQDGDELAFGSASLRWLEKEPVQAKRFPVWVPVVLLLFVCVTVLGLWTVFNRDNQAADRTTIALTAEEVALATQQAEEASGRDTVADETSSSQASGDASVTSDENASEGDSASVAAPTPVRLKVPVPSEPSADSESEEATAAEETTIEPASEAVTSCPHPDDWVQMTVEQGQKLRDIARKAKTQPRIIVEANCLPNTKVKAGIVLWVPLWEGAVPVAVADATGESESGSEAAATEKTASETESGDAAEAESAAVAETTETAEVAEAEASESGETAATEEMASDTESGDVTEAESVASETTESAEAAETSETAEAVVTEEAAVSTESSEATETETEAEDSCPAPDGWVQMTVEAGQKVRDIAKIAGTTARKIKDANCLPNYTISAGEMLWVPQWEEAAEAEDGVTESSAVTEVIEEVVETAKAAVAAVVAEVIGTEDDNVDAEEACPAPDGWVQMTVKAGQKVRDIAKIAGTTPRKIKDANCLPNYTISAGDMLWVPQWEPAADSTDAATEVVESTEAAESTATEAAETEDACPIPDGWVQMTVEAGQKVKDIAKLAGTRARKIKDANCLPNYTISAGDMLWVPQWEPEGDDEETTTGSAESTEPSEVTETEEVAETEAEGSCPVPDGWEPATIEEDMKLKDIAEILGSKARVIKEGNCLPSYKVTPGQVIWVPLSLHPLEKDAETAVDDIAKCPYPENWVQMTVQKGQKLRDIARAIGVQPWEIKVANCLPDTKVQAGMILWVPRWDGRG